MNWTSKTEKKFQRWLHKNELSIETYEEQAAYESMFALSIIERRRWRPVIFLAVLVILIILSTVFPIS